MAAAFLTSASSALGAGKGMSQPSFFMNGKPQPAYALNPAAQAGLFLQPEGIPYTETPASRFQQKTAYYQTLAKELKSQDYRPVELITRNAQGLNSQRVITLWDENGTYMETTESGLVIITQQPNGSDWGNLAREKIILDENGDMVEFYTDKGSGSAWNPDYRFVATYDANHNQLTATQTFHTDTGWFARLAWVNEYDENNNIIHQTYYNKALESTQWTLGLKIDWEYDASGNNTKETRFSWREGSQSYVESQRWEYDYDDKGRVVAYRFANYGTYTLQYTYSYDEEGKQVGGSTLQWLDGEWAEIDRTTITWDGDRPLLMELEGIRHDEWTVVSRTEYIYSGDTTIMFDSKWNTAAGDSLCPAMRTTSISNEAGFLEYKLEEPWAASLQRYYQHYQYLYTYDENYNILTQKHQFANWDASWNVSSWTSNLDYTFTYDENGNGASVNAEVRNPNEDFFIPYNMHQNHLYITDDAASYAEVRYLDMNEYVNVSNVSLNYASLEMLPNETRALAATVLPAHASNPEVYWYSSDPSVARADINGLITAKAAGQAIVTARTLDQQLTASCVVSVLEEVGQVANPVFFPASGEIVAGTEITIMTTTTGASIYYTTDETEPTAQSTPYSAPIVASEDMTIKAVAMLESKQSEVVTAQYTVKEEAVEVADPVFRPGSGAVEAGTAVSISCATPNAIIYYHIDTFADAGMLLYKEPILVGDSMTLKAVAVIGNNVSDTVTAVYTIAETHVDVAEPLFNPASGEVLYGTLVTMMSSTQGAKIYYTLDETEPTENSMEYVEPVAITKETVIKAIAVLGTEKSDVATAVYKVRYEVADPQFYPFAGTVPFGTEVYITCKTEGSTIYYTTDGSEPTRESAIYGNPIAITEDMTIKAMAVWLEARSNIMTAVYTVEASNEGHGELEARLYPNPNNGNFFVEVPCTSNIRIFNLNGQLLRNMEKKSAGVYELHLDHSGMYILHVSDETGRLRSVKSIIVR